MEGTFVSRPENSVTGTQQLGSCFQGNTSDLKLETTS